MLGKKKKCMHTARPSGRRRGQNSRHLLQKGQYQKRCQLCPQRASFAPKADFSPMCVAALAPTAYSVPRGCVIKRAGRPGLPKNRPAGCCAQTAHQAATVVSPHGGCPSNLRGMDWCFWIGRKPSRLHRSQWSWPLRAQPYEVLSSECSVARTKLRRGYAVAPTEAGREVVGIRETGAFSHLTDAPARHAQQLRGPVQSDVFDIDLR